LDVDKVFFLIRCEFEHFNPVSLAFPGLPVSPFDVCKIIDFWIEITIPFHVFASAPVFRFHY